MIHSPGVSLAKLAGATDGHALGVLGLSLAKLAGATDGRAFDCSPAIFLGHTENRSPCLVSPDLVMNETSDSGPEDDGAILLTPAYGALVARI